MMPCTRPESIPDRHDKSSSWSGYDHIRKSPELRPSLFRIKLPKTWALFTANPPMIHPPQSINIPSTDPDTTPMYPGSPLATPPSPLTLQKSIWRTFPQDSCIRAGEAYGTSPGNTSGACRGYWPSGLEERGGMVLWGIRLESQNSGITGILRGSFQEKGIFDDHTGIEWEWVFH